MSQWTLFSNHGHVLLFIAREPEARLRDVAAEVGITERAVQKIIKDLQDGGVVNVRKHGRCNRYRVQMRKPLRHKLEAHCSVGDLVRLIHEDLPITRSPGSGVSGTGTGPVTYEPEKAPGTQEPAPVAAVKKKTPARPQARETVGSEAGPAPAEEPAPQPVAEKPEKPEEPEKPEKPGKEVQPGEDKTTDGPKKKKTRKKPADDSQGSLF